MDSPLSQASSQLQRMRTYSNYSVHPLDNRGAVRKRAPSSSQYSVSATQADRLYQYALEQQSSAAESCGVSLTSAPHWLTPQSSPQPQGFPEAHQHIEPFPQWSVPTPPRSDSGLPTVFDANEVPVTTGISATADFTFHQQPTAAAEMSSLGFLLPSQYGSGPIEAEPGSYNMEQNYIPPPRLSQAQTTSGASAYAQTASSSPALYQSRSAPPTHENFRRYSDLSNTNTPEPSYNPSFRRMTSSYDSGSSVDYSMVTGQSIPSISGLVQSPQPSPHLGSNTSGMMPQYSNPSRSPSLYEQNMYSQSFSSAPTSAPVYSQSLSYPPPFVGSSVNEVMAKPLGSDASIRVLNQRPKPQCWEHGCNGRQFSTFSNLLRHQREKSGSASKSYCPKCGAEFTRTTARNGHLAHDKCTKTRRPSDPQ
ncbi:uncharacterized protein LTR77_003076 [Saxophila tyrrhenica]|uniref:Uncharacterized protein n=1 Tax=Saxophila tyrrhenica TaxID=1690608 RepID=A0AAV9PJ57_9PEZI|nr:hypothetical protein LTR77_003076 [Saxophila tyrrhenica]